MWEHLGSRAPDLLLAARLRRSRQRQLRRAYQAQKIAITCAAETASQVKSAHFAAQKGLPIHFIIIVIH